VKPGGTTIVPWITPNLASSHRLPGGYPLDRLKRNPTEGLQFFPGDAQWGHEDKDIPEGPQNCPEVPGFEDHPVAGAPGYGKRFPGLFIRHQFNSYHEAPLAHVPHVGMSRHLSQALL
jgi:hypothetical protein